MKKLLIALVAGAFVLSACSSEEAPTTVKVKKHHVKHGHKKSASAAKCK